jgi:hypothetical protein
MIERSWLRRRVIRSGATLFNASTDRVGRSHNPQGFPGSLQSSRREAFQ